MADKKKILVSLPTAFLAEVDALLETEEITRSEFVRRAMRFYMDEKRKEKIRLQMEQGYREMGEINLEIARACHCADTETMLRYEENLG
ncbi:MAG: ribbon-helix-helix protein, CopG family [Clostridia bacterium]|nr:ribbon-helix-helix protein, CopG family [Clostridia bacterium]